jgi:hypothetical protein
VLLCLQATWQVITAPKEHLKQTTYNVTAVSFTPAELAEAIKCVCRWQDRRLLYKDYAAISYP